MRIPEFTAEAALDQKRSEHYRQNYAAFDIQLREGNRVTPTIVLDNDFFACFHACCPPGYCRGRAQGQACIQQCLNA